MIFCDIQPNCVSGFSGMEPLLHNQFNYFVWYIFIFFKIVHQLHDMPTLKSPSWEVVSVHDTDLGQDELDLSIFVIPTPKCYATAEVLKHSTLALVSREQEAGGVFPVWNVLKTCWEKKGFILLTPFFNSYRNFIILIKSLKYVGCSTSN